jgi:hypothetical protein
MPALATEKRRRRGNAVLRLHESFCPGCGRATLEFESLEDGTVTVYFEDVNVEAEDDFLAWSREQTEAFMRWLIQHPDLAEDDDRVCSLLALFPARAGANGRAGRLQGAALGAATGI